tara:strand:+ start:492 stop:863 length:372 start_codon:yes stop_codon:yes gene_type:complete
LSLQQMPPKPIGENWLNWSQRLATYLIQVRSQLRQKASEESAAEDGVILWDRSVGYPVVSKSGLFVGFELKSPGYTVSSLPTGVVGQREYVTDASSPSFGAAVSGGGSVVIPVFKNASAWVVG